jgi:hypothetical protein
VAVRYHAVLKVFYERWRAAGKAAQVALTALHAQAVDDPERHGQTSQALARAGGAECIISKAPLTNKTVAPLRSRFGRRLIASVRRRGGEPGAAEEMGVRRWEMT